MPNIFWGNILQGLSQGMQQADERKHKRELLDLQKRHMDSEDKLRDGQIGELKRKLTQGDFQNAIAQHHNPNRYRHTRNIHQPQFRTVLSRTIRPIRASRMSHRNRASGTLRSRHRSDRI